MNKATMNKATMNKALFGSLIGCLLLVAGCSQPTNPNAPPPQDPAVGFAEAVRSMVNELNTTESPESLIESLVETLGQADGVASAAHKPIYIQMDSVGKEIQSMIQSRAARDQLNGKIAELEQLAQGLPGTTVQ